MKHYFAALLLPAMIGLSTWSSPISTETNPSSAFPLQSQNGNSNLLLIQGKSDDIDGWVDIAPVGSKARHNSRDGNMEGLVHLPFSTTGGDTKIIVNMDHASWIFTSGNSTQIEVLGSSHQTSVQNEKPKTLMISNLKLDRLAEVSMQGSGGLVSMDGPEKYLINADLLRWAKIPDEASVSVIE
jgi:hypothetical protein